MRSKIHELPRHHGLDIDPEFNDMGYHLVHYAWPRYMNTSPVLRAVYQAADLAAAATGRALGELGGLGRDTL